MRRRKYEQGKYTCKNPGKYFGKHTPHYRSSWELVFMRMCDGHPSVIGWASEGHSIPYRNPFTGKHTVYVPDFMIVYQNKKGQKRMEMVEIKPSTQSSLTEAKSRTDKAAVALNHAKWTAASEWCKRKGINFRIVTEKEIFNNYGRSKR
jgi:hypothetical protein|tara:strand:- start:2851 stop:3297 length:447 start_codon:yes stop_codon:yes gene_type:complete